MYHLITYTSNNKNNFHTFAYITNTNYGEWNSFIVTFSMDADVQYEYMGHKSEFPEYFI